MAVKLYYIWLDNKKIGTTELEKADVPMGVVFGKVIFTSINSGYDFFKTYCLNNSIEIINDYAEDRLIVTAVLPELKIINSNGIEIKGQGTTIEGMDSDAFEVTILGIPFPFFEKEFPHHVIAYNNQFKIFDSENG